MQTAQGPAVKKSPPEAPRVEVQPPARRFRPSTTTLLLAGLVTVAVLGCMVSTLLGIWPPKSANSLTGISSVVSDVKGYAPSDAPKPSSLYAKGITIEKLGQPTKQGDQVTVRLKVTNGVMQPPALKGTATPNAPTPGLEPAKLYNATVKVLFYDKSSSDPTKKIVGSAVGNMDALPDGLAPNASKEIEVVATNVGDFKDYAAFPDTVWTDKDAVKIPESQTPAEVNNRPTQATATP